MTKLCTKLVKKLQALAMAALVLAPAAASAEKISKHKDSEGFEDWYWEGSVTVKRGQSHTFWAKELTAKSAIMDMEVWADYTYKEDGETYEDRVYASESCEKENSYGGFDKYVLLTAEDWVWVPESKSSLKFKVRVSGWEPDESQSTADISFKYGHSEGSGDYPKEPEEPVPQMKIRSFTPRAVENVSNVTASASQRCSFVYNEEREDDVEECRFSLPLVAGVEYWMGIVGDGSFFETFYWSQTPAKNLLETGVVIESVTNVWRGCSEAYRLSVPYTGDYILCVTNGLGSTTVGFQAVYEDHLAVNFPDVMRAPICPGYVVEWSLTTAGGAIKSVTGLPRGLAATIGSDGGATITGAATEIGSFDVRVEVTNGGDVRTSEKSITVADVPCKGAYTGFMSVPLRNGLVVPAPLAMTVDAKGKLSGSLTVNGKKVALSVGSCESVDVNGESISYLVAFASGTGLADMQAGSCRFVFSSDAFFVENPDWEDGNGLSCAYRTCEAGAAYTDGITRYVDTYQVAFETTMSEPDSWMYSSGTSVFSLVVDKTGKVALKGYLPDGTAVSGSGKLAGPEMNSVALIVTGTTFGTGAYAANIVFDSSGDGAWVDCRAIRTATRNADACAYEFASSLSWFPSGRFATRYDATCALPEGFTPETTRLVLKSGEAQYAYDLSVDAAGNLKGLGNAVTKTAPKLALDVKTGLLTGSGCVGMRKVSLYGLLVGTVGAGGLGGGTVVYADGDCQDMTLSFEKWAEVEETLEGPGWAGETTGTPIYVGSGYSCAIGVLIDGVPAALTVSGLPKGLSYDAGRGQIVGRAEKVGTYAVKYSYSLGNKKITRTKTLVIAALPSGLGGGTYEGFADVSIDEQGNLIQCPFTATVSTEGGLSGSVTLGGKKLPFKAVGYDELDAAGGRLTYYLVPLDVSPVDRALSAGIFNLNVYAEEVVGWPESGRIVPQAFYAVRNHKTDKSYSALIAPFVGTHVLAARTTDSEGKTGMTIASLVLDKTGGVKISGTFMNGSTFSASGVATVYGWFARVIVPITCKTFSAGGAGLVLDVCSDGSGWVEAYVGDFRGASFALASGEYRPYAFEPLFCDPFAPGCWLGEEMDPQTAYLALEANGLQAFYEVEVDAKGNVTGIGKTLNGAALNLKFDAKTGMFSGSVASSKGKQGCKVFGVLNRAVSSSGYMGAGAIVWNDGSCESLNMSWRQIAVSENLGCETWRDEENPIRMGSRVAFTPSVLVDDSPLPLTITGLPAGMKYSAADGITGTPTKSGTHAVKITYSLGSKKVTRTETMIVVDFPAGLVGTYNGFADVGVTMAGITIPCPLTATLDNKGALKGTITAMGKKITFAATGFDSFDPGYGNVEFQDVEFNLTAIDAALANVCVSLTIGPISGLWNSGESGDGLLRIENLSADRDATRDAGRAQSVAPFVGNWAMAQTVEDSSGNVVPIVVSATVDAKGGVKVTGTFHDGTTISGKGVLVVHPAGAYASGVMATVALPMTAKALEDGGWLLALSWLSEDEDFSVVREFTSGVRGTCFKLKNGYGVSMNVQGEIFAGSYQAGCWFDQTLVPVATDLVLIRRDDDDVETVCVPVTADKTGTVNGCAISSLNYDWGLWNYIVNDSSWADEYGDVHGSRSLRGLTLKIDNKTGLLTGTISGKSSPGELCCGMIASTGRAGKVYGVLAPATPGDGIRGLAIVVWSDDSSVELIEIGSRSQLVNEDFGGLEKRDAAYPLEVGSSYLFSLSVLVGSVEKAAQLKVSGLPTGLDYEPMPNFGQMPRIVGVPTKAGTYKVSIAYTIGSQTAVRGLTIVVR